jgi:hypothetical protein
VEDEVFWANYFYRVELIKLKHNLPNSLEPEGKKVEEKQVEEKRVVVEEKQVVVEEKCMKNEV